MIEKHGCVSSSVKLRPQNKAHRFTLFQTLSGIYCACVYMCMFCSVCQVPVAEGKSVQQTVDILHKKLEQLGAVKQGSFCVDCETYHATGNVSGKCLVNLLII